MVGFFGGDFFFPGLLPCCLQCSARPSSVCVCSGECVRALRHPLETSRKEKYKRQRNKSVQTGRGRQGGDLQQTVSQHIKSHTAK
jgi:hypothetical protein